MSFSGMRVLSLESRRAVEIAALIRKHQGEPFVAPSLREIPLEDNAAALRFGERLLAGEFDMVVLLTGVGLRLLGRVLETRYAPERFPEALRRVAIVARGPKPAAVLREMNVPIAVLVPEPNTWREVLRATGGRPERRIAVQEYGRSNPELLDGLRRRGADVTPVPVYQWGLPEDTGPLRSAARQLAAGEFSAALFTAAAQVDHLMRIADEEGVAASIRDALSRMVIASIGPATSEALASYGLSADLEPSHPKMGILVQEAAQRAAAVLENKLRDRN